MYNEEMMEQIQESEFPWLVFKIKDKLYTVNSKTITSIIMLPDVITKVPNLPDYMTGLIHLRGSVVPLVDLRKLFGLKSVQEEYEDFKLMIDKRKQEHIDWVNEFEHNIENNEEFNLNSNPHECAFGKWYDNFKSDYEAVNFHLNKIDEPHKKIHAAVDEAKSCSHNCEDCSREKCLRDILQETKEKNMPYLISLLDEVKDILSMQFKQMIIVLENENTHIGIIVDEVLSVENLKPFDTNDDMDKMCKDKYVCGIAKSEKNNNIMLILDESKIMNVSEQ